MYQLTDLRAAIRTAHHTPEDRILETLIAQHGLTPAQRAKVSTAGASLVIQIRRDAAPGVMELFLADYGLSSEEGVALMCLAEALLRVPDAATMDDLIEDKIAPSDWGVHLGKSSSSLINASTWALMLTGKVLQEPRTRTMTDVLHATLKRVGEPIVRRAVLQAMKVMGHQFVLGQSIEDAARRARSREAQGYTYSYDMLGEAAVTQADADTFYESYKAAISYLGTQSKGTDVRDAPGISIKLSALHPRYEQLQADRVMSELVPRVLTLAQMACYFHMGLNIDAEEADRLDLSLDIIEAVLSDPSLDGWDGFGVVVQAYGKRAGPVIDWLHALAQQYDRKIMVRLVKGAYWDTEVKQAQVLGLAEYPVFTTKAGTDVSYLCCAQKLLNLSDRIYPQFATHNAHTLAAILEMAQPGQSYEFQRLHGMGEAVHDIIRARHDTRCRIYAPVGVHRDLLAYLVRRLLENGANSSFVHQLVDPAVSPDVIAADPFAALGPSPLPKPPALYEPQRRNSQGWHLQDPSDQARFDAARSAYSETTWEAGPLIAGPKQPIGPTIAGPVGRTALATPDQVAQAVAHATPWAVSPSARAQTLNRAADLFEESAGPFFALLAREAGKIAQDAVDELREAVDFLRFYASEATQLGDAPARGVVTCISPWNFPLAIFTGQIAAALAAGNAVLAKPADPTPTIAYVATQLFHQAGVPLTALQMLPGDGPGVGAALTQDPRVAGVCFTGSTCVAQTINRSVAAYLAPDACLIAETGGLNAMIVDSTALPEQAIKDVIDSAFRSAGQRCSALRVLYLQEDVAQPFLNMLFGAMDTLRLGDPWDFGTDVGPIITKQARQKIAEHIAAAVCEGRLLKQCAAPETGCFVGPAVIRVSTINDLAAEVFGPVLHIATFKAEDLGTVLNDINASGYGLTFGLHTRIDSRVEEVRRALKVGNLYVNRNQIGAVVESQPFGGEGLSGTGPKAGGPLYVKRFTRGDAPENPPMPGPQAPLQTVQAALDTVTWDPQHVLDRKTMRGPTGELNQWTIHPKGRVLCLGPTSEDAQQQMSIARKMGCGALGIAPGLTGPNTVDGVLEPADLSHLTGAHLVVSWANAKITRPLRQALAQRDGPILPFATERNFETLCGTERHLCVDTTAVGGNTDLMGGAVKPALPLSQAS